MSKIYATTLSLRLYHYGRIFPMKIKKKAKKSTQKTAGAPRGGPDVRHNGAARFV
jgi:hypothetical protein